jgi:hypothetical protein
MSYLIEIRMFGQAKYDVRELIFQVNKRFNIPIKRPVPHITLVGPIDTNQEAKLIADFISICNHTGFSTSPTGSENHLSPLRFQTFNRKVF